MRWLALAAAASVAPLPAAAQGSRFWRAEERAVISDFSEVVALAATDRLVFVATRNGLGLYDRQFRRWEVPITFVDGYPRESVRAALADPTDESVLLATAQGLIRYRPLLRQFESVVIPGGVRAMFYDRDDPFRGIYVLTGAGWELLPGGSFIPMPATGLPPPGRRVGQLTLDEFFARQPVADAMRGVVLTDERFRTFRYTSAVAVPLAEEYYLGTDGLGVIRLDAPIAQFERLPFGLLAPGVGALLAVPGGVWAGTDHRSRRSGLAFVGEDLQRYAYREGPRATGLGITGVRALLGREDEIWAATDRGVWRFAPDGDARRLGTAQGLPDEDTFALAQGPSGVWVGTAFGLAFVTNDGVVRRLGRGVPVPVLALSAARDTVWVGTTDGLGRATPDQGIFLPPDVAAVPDLKTAIVAIAQVADTVVVSSIDRIIWRAPGEEWRVERLVSPDLGPVFALAPDAGGVWIGGQRGIAFFRFAIRDYRFYRVPGDVPGPVRDLVVNGEYLWVATEAGLVRFARAALIP